MIFRILLLLIIPLTFGLFAPACSKSAAKSNPQTPIASPPTAPPPDPATLPYATWSDRFFANNASVFGEAEKNPFNNGVSPSSNKPIPIPPSLPSPPSPASAMRLAVTDEPVSFDAKAKGIRIYVINDQTAPASLSTYSDQLYLHQEALTETGRWMPIQALPWGLCGSPGLTLFLPARSAWRIDAPRYNGSFKTKIRFALTGIHNKDHLPPSTVYSNEFEGSIDPAFFRINPQSYPALIVDTPQSTFCPPIQGNGIPPAELSRIHLPLHMLPEETTLPLLALYRPTTIQNRFQATQVYLINNSNTPLQIPTAKGIPPLRQEARDPLGNWLPIETLPSNGPKKNITLNPNHAFALADVKYSGSFKTQLRFALDLSPTQTLYSNEFDGSINPGQFVTPPNPHTSSK